VIDAAEKIADDGLDKPPLDLAFAPISPTQPFKDPHRVLR
jgi:hypothetical protein